MTTTIVNNATPFGAISNEMVVNIYAVDAAIKRIQAAAANAAAGYAGTAGTEFETGSIFGVSASGTPGEKGSDWQYAVNVIGGAWTTFMAAAQGAITALDNG